MTIDPDELHEKCDHDPCHCVPDASTAVADGKSVYCSPGCARGEGCDHTECACASAAK